jgi:hypothetical protein
MMSLPQQFNHPQVLLFSNLVTTTSLIFKGPETLEIEILPMTKSLIKLNFTMKTKLNLKVQSSSICGIKW